jgi:hypothetical protein
VCLSATVSELSASWFRAEAISLTSSFAEYRKPVSYPAKNDRGDDIGAILSDGVAIEFNDLAPFLAVYELCIDLNEIYTQDTDFSLYSVYDFAKSNKNISLVIVQQLNVLVNGSRLCADILPLEIAEVYFAVIRISDVNGTIEYFDQSTIVLLYCLAVLFLLSSIYGFLILSIVAVQVIRGKQTFKLQLFVVLVCLISFNTSK